MGGAAVTTNNAPTQTGGGATRTVTPAQASSGAFRLTPLTQQTQQRYLKALFYGPPGVGKSTLAGSATNIPEMRDVLLITAEGGDIVFEDNPRVHDADNIDMMKLMRIEQLTKVFEFLQHHCRARDRGDEQALENLQRMVFGIPPGEDCGRIRKYRTVIIDSLTDLEALNMNAVLGLDSDAGMGFSVGDDFEAPGYTQFRKNNNTIQAVVRSFRNLELNLIVICGHKWSQNEHKVFHYTPWLTGQLATQVQSFVDLVGYMVVSSADPQNPDLRRLYVQPQASIRFDAKCRRAKIARPFYDNPELADIMRDFGFAAKVAV